MLTIFTTPKPFRGHIGVIQRNALESWTTLGRGIGREDAGLKAAATGAERPEVIVFGDEEGTAEVCQELGLRHEPEVERSPSGTKYLRSIFGGAQEMAKCDVVAYVNCDIVLTDDFARAVAAVAREFGVGKAESGIATEARRAQGKNNGEILRFAQDDNRKNFLMVGRRWDTDITEAIDFGAEDWAERARAAARSTKRQRGPDWIDYFVFRRGMYEEFPALVIGRVAWDNWLVWKARSQGAAVVDASRAVTAIHQNHDYGYHPDGQQGVWHDAEARRNLELAGGLGHVFTIEDATHRLTPGGEIAANPGYPLAPARRAWRRGRAAVWHAILGATRPVRHALGIRRSD